MVLGGTVDEESVTPELETDGWVWLDLGELEG